MELTVKGVGEAWEAETKQKSDALLNVQEEIRSSHMQQNLLSLTQPILH